MMKFVVTYRFNKVLSAIQRSAITLTLRKDGFMATEEFDRDDHNDLLRTNATAAQVRLSAGRGWVIYD